MFAILEKLLLIWKGKTYLAALGLVGLSVYDLSVGDYTSALTHLLAAVAAAGLRTAVTEQTNQIKSITAQQTEELKKTAGASATLKVASHGDY